MRGKLTLLAGVCASAIAFPAFAQSADDNTANDADTIIVTAQRSNQRLQDVPIAVSAFSSEALEKQQIKNTSDLQLTLPNVTFTKTNFTSSSFTIRGIGDLCVGVTCDSATAIHLNDAPLFGTRIFEGEFYDLAQVEVLRGPQGTLFGRNATSGVVNFRTARPDLSGFGAAIEAEYGNYNAVKVKGMVNAPIGENVAVRLAGFYLNREGYTQNLFDNTRIDDRDMYGVRGSIRLEPSETTTIDIMAQYFHERDSRMRIQKQLCQRDPTGVMGCLNGTLANGTTNANTTFVGVLTSREFFAIRGLPTALALGSIYGPDAYSGVVNPADTRVVNTDTKPSYFTDELIIQGSLAQELGGGINVKLSGNYQEVEVDSSQDYNNSVQNRAVYAPALAALASARAGGFGAAVQTYLTPVYNALTPNGAAGQLCTSLAEETGTGAFGGHRVCSMTPQDFDRSNQKQSSWTAEAIVSSDWDGMFNFLVGGIYGELHMTENSYYVNSFGIDYFTGVVGAFSALGAGLPPSYLATPTYRNNTDDLKVKTYGLFGEAYFKFNDQLKLTLGIRYNNDEKTISARTTLASFLAPFTSTDAYASPYIGSFDADAGLPGNQLFQNRKVNFSEWTGRAVLDYAITPDNLIYASYSRGYKSGGINPPLSPVFSVPEGFKPEFVNAFEVGSKNQFGNITLNLTAFYYKYKDLQLSRIVARTSVNDNVSADIWGLEAEAIIRPTRELSINLSGSYLNTKVSEDKLLANPRDFGAGRSDSVIIKDITNGANCAVAPTTAGNAAGTNGFVNQANALINAGAIPGVAAGAGLQPTTSFGAGSGLASTGAFGICSVLEALAPTVGAAFGGVQVYSSGIPVNIKGNKLPGAPDYKFSAGVQYAAPLGEMTLTPRADFVYTGKSTGNIFNGAINAIDSFTQVNAQLQLDGPDKKWFARLWVQNLFDKDSVTGLYVTDQSSGNYTNIFTLEPRRYGISAGLKF
ncbi:TonB-dependent receptor [Novosphingobium sp.]|uniref:TonB-dependent receptor n=1 Tax=Novosphingobium sp. TaxID=1874826 RepID=UPI002736FA65|nr:TonB-dependent receptor [Novosphingobium sp.]MDP3907707.1 TonB-dependent receptor [Novosphingobium sp.]